MLKVGLSGNRYSGKKRVANLFSQIGVPIFDADVIVKFVLNYNYELMAQLKDVIGENAFKQGKLDMKYVTNNKLFDKILDTLEIEVFKAYDKFQEKHKGSVYTIFSSSILFERNWQKKMDLSISVFASKNERLKRAKYFSDVNITTLHKLANSEIDELVKNKMADFIVHNYDASANSLDDVCEIDKKIIDSFLETLRKQKNETKIETTF